MKRSKNQSGFVHALILLVVAVVVVGGIGYAVYHHNKAHKPSVAASSSTSSQSKTQSPVANNVSTAPTISSTSDLDNALSVLNQNDPSSANSSDQSQLSSQSNF